MSEDLISRQAAIDALTALEEPAPTARDLIAIYDCEDAIKALPPIQSEPRGRWIPDFGGKFKGGAYRFRCSRCGRVVPNVRNGGWNYCPNCGARMEGEQDE